MPVVGILRGAGVEQALPAITAAVKGGIRSIEITLDSPSPYKQIEAVRDMFSDSIDLGAGTVLTVADAKNAIAAGAEFVVCPAFIPDVVEYCVKENVPVIPGVMTPTECRNAYLAGARMLKLFPAGALGVEYIKQLKGPFPDFQFLVTGGIDMKSAKGFLDAGAMAVGIGSDLFRKDWITAGKWDAIEQQARKIVEIIAEGK